jgi:phenylalanyl-tRNA synthetase alpha chain
MENVFETLHPLERKVLPFLKQGVELREISKVSGLKEIEVMRALQWLENKGALKIRKFSKEIINLDENGKIYLKEGLPERRFLKVLDKKMNLKEVKNKTGLNEDEIKVCIGILKRRYALTILGETVEPTSERRHLLSKGFAEEEFLKRLPLDISKLSKEEREIYIRLKKRKKIIKTDLIKLKKVDLTEFGKNLVKKFKEGKIKGGMIERLTPEMLKRKLWEGKKFRKYDIRINVPKIYGGKRHPYNEFILKVREKLVNLGFKEMDGPIIELEFFNFDALYQPQNHPARDWSATYRIKEPKYGVLPDKRIVDSVRKVHENGGETESTGWGYKWDERIAKRLMPRAHDTAISPRYLIKDLEIPGKYFSLVRCFRPDVIDATHAVEFNQLGGFVLGKCLSFRHLLGLLKQFAIEIAGAKKVRFVPGYFPFTEPSVEIYAKHEKFGCIELAGAGVFRPELTNPLGVKVPVIAWGFGIDRLAMMRLNVKDIRDLFSHDLKFLRKTKKVF